MLTLQAPSPAVVQSLQARLNSVMSRLVDTSKSSKLIAINLSVLVGRHRALFGPDAAGINVVAGEIQHLSEASGDNIEKLDQLFAEVRTLTKTINKAGRQRMLSQVAIKYLLINHIQPSEEIRSKMEETLGQFAQALAELKILPMNTSEIKTKWNQVEAEWLKFVDSTRSGDLPKAIESNRLLLNAIQSTVEAYEHLSGR